MKFKTYSHKQGVELFNTSPRYQHQWDEVEAAISNVSDTDLIEYFENNFSGGQKSLSHAINALLSPTSLEEVGSIHTVQGYDLNYAGVIIGPDLGYDPVAEKIVFHRENYHDKKGKENNPRLGIEYTDEDLLNYVINIYRVLMTRGIKGTFVYVCDYNLKVMLKRFFSCYKGEN